ncbi:MAG TPA: GNAT family N-acetyltransferase [Prolixibacteraceae bacterium]|nr:GNAT family N-acetyltransferase [Prolixibacteraceae bacterium]
MKDIIAPVSKEALIAELTPDKLMRQTNKADNEIYVITHQDSPNVMREIGRVREITFRDAGGGIGEELDIDAYDICDDPYKQLIVWDPQALEIIGGYRYILCKDVPVDEKGVVHLATTHLFNFSEKFIKEYLPYTLELGRSFVQPHYQSSKAGAKALFALDNLWDGLGALIVNHPEIKYFFGKVTMYTHFHTQARNLIQYFFMKYFNDRENLVTPINPMDLGINMEEMEKVFKGGSYKEDYKILSQKVREFGENIPPLINSYMNLSPSMKTFGTVINDQFGHVEETGIILTISDIYAAKTDRHIETYLRTKETTDWPLPE